MDFILNIPLQFWISTIIALAGCVLAVVFYRRSRRKARLAVQYYEHITLVGGRGAAFPDEAEIRFARVVVPRITSSKIVIWNCGDRTIRGTDLVKSDPLRIEVSEAGQILKYTILRQTRSVNMWKIDQSSLNRLDLTFDFVDPGDGINLEVIHSQTRDEFVVVGTIMGIPKGLLDYGLPWLGTRRPQSRVYLAINVSIGAIMMLFALLAPQLNQGVRWVMGGVGFLNAALAGFLLWSAQRWYPASLTPKQDDTNGK